MSKISFQVDSSDLLEGHDYKPLAHDLRVSISTENARLLRAIKRQADYQQQTVEEYLAECIAAMVVSDEGQSELLEDGTIDRP
jgi:antirestriction protein ArdC